MVDLYKEFDLIDYQILVKQILSYKCIDAV